MRTSYWPLLLFPLFLAGQAGCPTEETDADGDGYTLEGGDCDDNDGSINPGAAEICGDALDNDCDGLIDESCETPGFSIIERDSAIVVRGVDNGRAEPPEFNEAISWDVLEPFEGAVSGELEYVSAFAEQRSYVDARVIFAEGVARARGQDDYGYGQGEALSLNSFEVYFELPETSWVTIAGELALSQGSDGGDFGGEVYMMKEGYGPVVSITSTEVGHFPFEYAGELERGTYFLDIEAAALVELSGGGDAYPAATVEYSFELATY